MLAAGESKKQERVVLIITEKIKICELATKDMPSSAIAKKYVMGQSTLVDVQKSE